MKQKRRRRQQGERQQRRRRSDGETEPSEKLAISILIRNNFRLEAAQTERGRERDRDRDSAKGVAVEVAVEAVANAVALLLLVAWQNVKWPPKLPAPHLPTPLFLSHPLFTSLPPSQLCLTQWNTKALRRP